MIQKGQTETVVIQTDQCNTYGGLDLIKVDGEPKSDRGMKPGYYMRMQDCMGDSYEGPLTDVQLVAFYFLFGDE